MASDFAWTDQCIRIDKKEHLPNEESREARPVFGRDTTRWGLYSAQAGHSGANGS